MDNRYFYFLYKDKWIVFDSENVSIQILNQEEKANFELEKKVITQSSKMIPEEALRLTLNVANTCNMDCKYCYANGGTYHSERKLMSKEVAKRAIDVFYEHFGEIGSVKFIGGEPLMNREVVFFICDYIGQLYQGHKVPYIPDFIMATNGTILDDKIIDYSNKYNWRVGLSFDGPTEVHDNVRVGLSGNKTSAIIIDHIKKWKEATNNKCPSSANVCYSRVHEEHNIPVVEIVRFIQEELGIAKVNIVPVDASSHSAYSLLNPKLFADGIIDMTLGDSTDYAITKLKKLEKVIRAGLSASPEVCKAGITTFGVSTEGIISPCHLLTDDKGFYMGNVFDEKPFEKDSFCNLQKQLKSYSRYDNPQCAKCICRKFCIGCLGGNNFRTGNPYRSDEEVCMFMKTAVTSLIKKIGIEKINEMEQV